MALEKSEANKAQGIDKQFLLAAIALELFVQGLLDDTSNAMVDMTLEQSRADQIVDQDKLVDGLIAAIALFILKFADTMEKGAGRIAQLKADEALEKFVPLLRSVKAGDAAIALKQETNNYATDIAKRFRFREVGGETFDDRILTLKEGTEKTVRNIVANGVKNGKGAKAIAKDIEAYINPIPGAPKARPWDIYRQRFGKAKNYVPKGVNPGTVQANALRIARTEAAEVYRNATDDFYRDRPWVKHFRWVLSNSHKGKDICDEYAAKVWGKDEKRPFSHPYCLCDWIAIPVTQTELAKMYERGEL